MRKQQVCQLVIVSIDELQVHRTVELYLQYLDEDAELGASSYNFGYLNFTIQGTQTANQLFFVIFTSTLLSFNGVSSAHGPSPQPTPCRSPLYSLLTATGSNQAKGIVYTQKSEVDEGAIRCHHILVICFTYLGDKDLCLLLRTTNALRLQLGVQVNKHRNVFALGPWQGCSIYSIVRIFRSWVRIPLYLMGENIPLIKLQIVYL